MLLLSLAGLTAIGIWIGREEIASNLIEDQLTQLGLPAEYEIVSIGPMRQVLRNISIGDPEFPDLIIEEIAVELEYGLGSPEITTVRVVRPRLFGTYRNGELSFGALDPVLFAESEDPASLPDLNLTLIDGRAQIASDFGMIGLKAEGAGVLNDSFEGILAASAPGITLASCKADAATLYGGITTRRGYPRFEGPMRLRGIQCEDEGTVLRTADIGTDIT
ncbi:MAG: hypothetical protein AAGK02_07855, partial [Pseudomonadota bacterium]